MKRIRFRLSFFQKNKLGTVKTYMGTGIGTGLGTNLELIGNWEHMVQFGKTPGVLQTR